MVREVEEREREKGKELKKEKEIIEKGDRERERNIRKGRLRKRENH